MDDLATLAARVRDLELWRARADAELRQLDETCARTLPALHRLRERVSVMESRVAMYAAIGGALAGIVSAVVASLLVVALGG